MQVGQLNKRITLMYKTSVDDGMGGVTVTDVSVTPDVWAAIWPASAKEIIQANSTAMLITHRVRIRYRSDITGAWKVKYGDRYFAIVAKVDPEERHEWLDLLCKEAA